MKSVFHLLLFLIFWGNCLAQLPQNFLFHEITNKEHENGLSQTSNHFIYKDSKGFVWISSIAGLNRFDGKNVKIYEEIIGDSTSLNGQFVQGVFAEDEKSNIWFTTYSALHYYDRKRDNFRHFFLRDSLGMPIPGFYNCGMDANQQLWLVHQDYLYLFNTKLHQFSAPIYLASDMYRGAILQNDTGLVTNFYAYTPGKPDLLIIETPQSNSRSKTLYLSESKAKISAVFPEQDSLVWLSTNSGLVKFNPLREDFVLFNVMGQDTIADLLGIASYGTHHLAISSFKEGLFFFNKNTLAFEQPISYPESKTSSPKSRGPIHVTRDSGLWLSVEGKGVNYTYPYELKFNKHLTLETGGYEGQQISFNSILEVNTGEIWAATYSNGIFVFDQSKEVVRRITKATYPEIASNSIIHIFSVDQNRILILTWGGLSIYYVDTNKFQTITSKHIFLYGYQSRNGRTLLSSYSADGIWEIDQNLLLKRVDQEKGAKFTFLYEDNQQRLYACKNLSSLNIFRQDTVLELVANLPLKGDFKTAYEKPSNDSVIWFGTTKGLINFNKITQNYEVYSRKNGLPSSTIYAILPDYKGNFWLSTNTGISCFNPNNLEYQNYGLMEGVSALEFNTFSYLKKSDNEIWFGSIDGLTTFIPKHIYSSTPPSVQIIEVLINDEISPELRCQRTAAANPSEMEEIELKHNQNTLSLSFTALEYAHPEIVRFQYKMEGLDVNWIKSSEGRRVRYSRLPSGVYTFQVKASTSIGFWSEVKSIKITILAPYYTTWWFFLAILSVIFLLIILGLRFRRKQKTKLQQVLEQQRDKFARDMHDELGSSISSLKLSIEYIISKTPSGELSRKLEDIANHSQKLYQKIREVIWAVNSHNDTLEKLIAYLHTYALEIFDNSNIECTIELPELIPYNAVSGKNRSNILFSYKEAINNIIQHSEASQVAILLTINSTAFTILVQDNGKGIPSQLLQNPTGNGLLNMQRRLQEIGGSCTISSSALGTTVLFSTEKI